MENTAQHPSPAPKQYAVDTRATYIATLASLLIGVIIAAVVGGLLFSLRQPLTTDAEGKVSFSLGAIMGPLAAAVTVLILAWAVFRLPIWFAKRQGVILDPEVWPWTGAVGVGIIAVLGFVGAMVLGII
jgi:hypothetical protein